MKRKSPQKKVEQEQVSKKQKVNHQGANDQLATEPKQASFKEKYELHKKVMEKNGCNVVEMTKLRQSIHQEPEGGFKEVKTQQKITDLLLKLGIEKENIKKCAQTGLVVDIKGKGAKDSKGVSCIALRADIDALPIPENNPDLPYKSTTDYAHMCGHDGHIAMLMAGAAVLAKNRAAIPKGQTIRLLLQPAEEGPGGALPMIKEGCLDGVDEVYGLHNIPGFDEGQIQVQPGPMFSAVTNIKIRVIGKGGHGSQPHLVKDPISAGVAVFNNLHALKSRFMDSKENIVFTITHFTSGHTYNVFPDEAFMEGTIRIFNDSILEDIKQKIRQIVENTARALNCEGKVDFEDWYPATINHETEAKHIERLAKKWFGEEHFSNKNLPQNASEDFSFFIKEKPGAFFFIGTAKPGEVRKTLHTSTYNFNDDLIASGGYFYVRLVEDRLGVSILKD